MKPNILIIAPHQSHVGSRAGGYIRLKEFLNYAPSNLSFKVIDISKSIYSDEMRKDDIELIHLPSFIYFLQKRIQIVGILVERIYVAFQVYSISKRVISDNNIKLIYVPIGEFLHFYLPAIFLKKRFPQVKLVVDILNFKIYKKGFVKTLKDYISNSNHIIIGLATGLISYISYKVVQKTVSSADYIFTVSPELVKTIKYVYKKDSIGYTPSGVSSSSLKIGEDKKKYLGVYVGRVTEQKGVYNLIETWKIVCSSHPNAQLAIAGLINADVSQAVNEKIQRLGLQKNIHVIGEVTEHEKVKILSKSEIIIHLANYEPLFPVIGILEGLAAGLPVVLFDMNVTQPVIKEVKNNNFLYVTKNGDIEAAAQEVNRIFMKDKQQKKTMQKNAREYALQFDWKEISKIEFSVIKNLINEK